MDYKIIALDIDGTLTNSQKEITPRTRYAIIDAQKNGQKGCNRFGQTSYGDSEHCKRFIA